MRKRTVTREEAEALAMAGLAMLAQDQSGVSRFFSLSGLDPSQIRELAPTAAFQAALLAHIRSDESLLLAFCANLGIEPASIASAETLLAGEQAR